MNDILSKILINKANELKKLDKNIIPIKRQNHYDFFQALKSDKISIIAEVKFKSPSEGLIYKNIDPLKIALEYQMLAQMQFQLFQIQSFSMGM